MKPDREFYREIKQNSKSVDNVRAYLVRFLINDANDKCLFSLSIPFPNILKSTIAVIIALLFTSFVLLVENGETYSVSPDLSGINGNNQNTIMVSFIYTEALLKNQFRIMGTLRHNDGISDGAESLHDTILDVRKNSELTPYNIIKRRYMIYENYLSSINEYALFYDDVMRNIPHRWPMRKEKLRINSEYGWRYEPLFFMKQKQFHQGMDIKAASGEGVYPSADGVVKNVINGTAGYGKLIVIEHSSGYVTYYAHLNKIFVKKNQIVTSESLVGESGNTGYSTGPHLHYEIRIGGKSINPSEFISY